MHNIVFGIKRAFLTSTTFLRRSLRRHFGLTQARFDILYLVRKGYEDQPQVRRELGITSSTISEMLRTLELLGLVWRSPKPGDRRARVIHFTPEGRKRTDAVIEQWINRRAGYRMIRDIFQWNRDPDKAFHVIDIFGYHLSVTERWFAPTMAHNPYPDFHPDD